MCWGHGSGATEADMGTEQTTLFDGAVDSLGEFLRVLRPYTLDEGHDIPPLVLQGSDFAVQVTDGHFLKVAAWKNAQTRTLPPRIREQIPGMNLVGSNSPVRYADSLVEALEQLLEKERDYIFIAQRHPDIDGTENGLVIWCKARSPHRIVVGVYGEVQRSLEPQLPADYFDPHDFWGYATL